MSHIIASHDPVDSNHDSEPKPRSAFLGLGLRPPAISWGVLLQEAQNISAVAIAPWTMVAPVLMVVIAVTAFNFMGDGHARRRRPLRHPLTEVSGSYALSGHSQQSLKTR